MPALRPPPNAPRHAKPTKQTANHTQKEDTARGTGQPHTTPKTASSGRTQNKQPNNQRPFPGKPPCHNNSPRRRRWGVGRCGGRPTTHRPRRPCASSATGSLSGPGQSPPGRRRRRLRRLPPLPPTPRRRPLRRPVPGRAPWKRRRPTAAARRPLLHPWSSAMVYVVGKRHRGGNIVVYVRARGFRRRGVRKGCGVTWYGYTAAVVPLWFAEENGAERPAFIIPVI